MALNTVVTLSIDYFIHSPVLGEPVKDLQDSSLPHQCGQLACALYFKEQVVIIIQPIPVDV